MSTQNCSQKEEDECGRTMPSLLLVSPCADGDPKFPPTWEILPRVSTSTKLKPLWSLSLKASVSQPSMPMCEGHLRERLMYGAHKRALGRAPGGWRGRKPPSCGCLWFLPSAHIKGGKEEETSDLLHVDGATRTDHS